MSSGSEPDVSVVVACYNCESTVAEAIRSALDQEAVAVEVIAADDCSSDDTAAAIAAIDDPRVRTLRLPENGGPGAARNAAIAEARGRWVAVLDADDAMLPGRLFRMIGLAAAEAAEIVCDNLEISEAGAPPRLMFDAGMLAAAGRVGLDRFILSNRLFASEYGFGYLKPLVRRDLLAGHGIRYDQAVRIGEDYLFLADCLAVGASMVVDPNAGYRYAVAEGSTSHRLTPGHVAAMLAADNRLIARRGAHFRYGDWSAQGLRTRSLRRAAAFLDLVDALKARDLVRAARIAIGNPAAVGHLSMPLKVRLGLSSRPRSYQQRTPA